MNIRRTPPIGHKKGEMEKLSENKTRQNEGNNSSIRSHHSAEEFSKLLKQHALSRCKDEFAKNNITSGDDLKYLNYQQLDQIESKLPKLKRKQFIKLVRAVSHVCKDYKKEGQVGKNTTNNNETIPNANKNETFSFGNDNDYNYDENMSNGGSESSIQRTYCEMSVGTSISSMMNSMMNSTGSTGNNGGNRNINSHDNYKFSGSDVSEKACMRLNKCGQAGDEEKFEFCDQYQMHPNISCYAEYKSRWSCYNCFNKDNLTGTDMYCNCCRSGLNPFYFFIKNKRKIDPRYKILTKDFGLIQGCDNTQTSPLVCHNLYA